MKSVHPISGNRNSSLAVRSLARHLASMGGGVAVLSLLASTVSASECMGIRMPDHVQVEGTKLVLNGMGLRRATVFAINVYVSGLYIPTRTRNAQHVLLSATPKRLVLHFLRDVDREEMANAIKDGVRKNTRDSLEAVFKKVDRVTRVLPPLRKGIELSFLYTPEKGLQVWVDKTLKASFNDAQLAEILFRVWFGSEPPDKRLKIGMLGGKCE